MAENNRGVDRPNTGLALVLMVALFIILWFVFHNTFAKIFLVIGQGLLQPLRFTVGLFQADIFDGLNSQFELSMTPANLKLVDFSTLVGLSSWMGQYYRWPLVLLMGWFAWRVWRHPILHLNTPHTFESLVQYQSQFWKQIVPVAHLNLVDDTSKPWLPARRCSDLAKEHKLIHARLLKLEETWLFLERQLGEVFNITAMKPHEKALFAVFAARIVRDKKAAAALLDEINESCRGSGIPNYKVADLLFEKYQADKRVLAKIRGYRYVRTVLFQMLVEARRFDGKLPTSSFVWLKPVDRTLWYGLERAPVDVGRYSIASFSEGISIAAQWQAESVAIQNRMRMGITRIDPDTETEYRVDIPYLVNAMTSLIIELEDSGDIDYPSSISSRIQSITNERIRFNYVRDEYVMPGLSGYFMKRNEQAKAAAIQKKALSQGDSRVAK